MLGYILTHKHGYCYKKFNKVVFFTENSATIPTAKKQPLLLIKLKKAPLYAALLKNKNKTSYKK